jgi:malate synthase
MSVLTPPLTEGASPVASTHPSDALAPQSAVLTPGAVSFVADLTRRFGGTITSLLDRRNARRSRIARGEERLDFLPETAAIRKRDWSVGAIPQDLERRVVEIT